MRLDPPLDASLAQGEVLVGLALPSGNSLHLQSGAPGPTSPTESFKVQGSLSQRQALWEIAGSSLEPCSGKLSSGQTTGSSSPLSHPLKALLLHHLVNLAPGPDPYWPALGLPVRPSEGLYSMDLPSMRKFSPPFLSKSTTLLSSSTFLAAPHSLVFCLPLTWGSSSRLHPSPLLLTWDHLFPFKTSSL